MTDSTGSAGGAGGPPAEGGGADHLATLLTAIEGDPQELLHELAATREAVVEDVALDRDLARAELDFLVAADRGRRYGAEFGAAVERAHRAALRSEFEFLSATADDTASTLFDLAELIGRLDAEGGAVGSIEAVRQELTRRIEGLAGVDEKLREEGRERFVALSTEEEDLDLEMRVALLRETASLFERLGDKFADRDLRRLGKRMSRVACDRVLAQRLDRVLTPRGARILENTSFFLLFVVFGLLMFEVSVRLEEETRARLLVIDASVCLFFICEFLFKLALAPMRLSWFLRNAVTDFLPAVPAALWFAVPSGGGAGHEAALFRMLQLLRVTWFARYVQALRPALRFLRLLLFMAKGMDALVQRFSPLLNRNFVFFEQAALRYQRDGAARVDEQDPEGAARAAAARTRTLAFRALRREQVLIQDLPADVARAELSQRADRLRDRLEALPTTARSSRGFVAALDRDVPVETAIENLYAVRPEEVLTWIPRSDIQAIDRVVRILNAPVVRNLPIVAWFRIKALGVSAEERIVQFGRCVAGVLERWRERALYLADLKGIVTGPQILDRLASAMVKASFRPARNLILFGLFFLLVRAVVGRGTAVGLFLSRFVATPVLVLGVVAAVVLAIGFWLKRLAGQAAEQFKLTSEASYIGLLELVKRRSQDDDLDFLARRVFRWEMDHWAAAGFIGHYVRTARTGLLHSPVEPPPAVEAELYRVALLYLHFLDGAVLHTNDVKTSEQLVANLSLENIRGVYLRHSRRDRKRLKKLSLQSGTSMFGPWMWFRCITESVSVETAKRVLDYNRNALSLRQREVASVSRIAKCDAWLAKRRRNDEGQLEQVDAAEVAPSFTTTEFTALDFLSVDPLREAHIERTFGPEVLDVLKTDRRTLIREIFGTRPLHLRPRAERTFNFYTFYLRRLSRGRVFLLPLHVLWLSLRSVRLATRNTVEIVREILSPERAMRQRESGVAPFAVALRKIRRMKAPILLEAMRLRTEFDPAYSGAPPGWSDEQGFEEVAELERDMEFLGMYERERVELREIAARNRRRVEELHAFVGPHSDAFVEEDADLARRGERAVTVAFLTDRDDVHTLARAEGWFERELVRMESPETRLPARTFRRLFAWIGRGFRQHPIDRWLATCCDGRSVSRRGRTNFKRAWHDGEPRVRKTVRAWLQLPAGVAPTAVALERAKAVYGARDEVSRELTALRVVQSLAVLDVRNYRRLVFEVGDYAADGESRDLAEALP